MSKANGGWDKPLAIDFHMRNFKADLAIEMQAETPRQTGALQNANRIFELGDYKLRIANKMSYALPQHDGATIPPFSLKGKAGTPKPGGGTYKRALMFAGASHPFTSRKGFKLKARQWVPKGLNAAVRKWKITWKGN